MAPPPDFTRARFFVRLHRRTGAQKVCSSRLPREGGEEEDASTTLALLHPKILGQDSPTAVVVVVRRASCLHSTPLSAVVVACRTTRPLLSFPSGCGTVTPRRPAPSTVSSTGHTSWGCCLRGTWHFVAEGSSSRGYQLSRSSSGRAVVDVAAQRSLSLGRGIC